MTTALKTVTSADGTTIALDQTGDGPPVILIGGAFNDRSTVAGLAAVLAPDFTVVTYDRRFLSSPVSAQRVRRVRRVRRVQRVRRARRVWRVRRLEEFGPGMMA
jgi:pimeloyl-ACP methyl ester carboxylesterase